MSFMRLKGVESGALQALSTRLAKVRFDMNSDSQVIGVDRHPDKLTVEIALRREREGLAFDDAKSTLVAQKGYEYSRRLLTLDAAAGIGCTPNSKRDLAQFAELLKSVRRASDAIGRLNAAQFVVLAPETGEEGVIGLAERLLAALAADGANGDAPGPLHFGCYAVPDFREASIAPTELLMRAAAALNESQAATRSAIRFFSRPADN